MLIVVLSAAVSAALHLGRYLFYFRLRPGVLNSSVLLRVLDRVLGSTLWRSMIVLALLMALNAWKALGNRFESETLLAGTVAALVLLYFAFGDRAVNRKIHDWLADPDQEFRVYVRSVFLTPIRYDFDAWRDLEGDLRKLVSRRTRVLREHGSDCVASMFAANADLVERHVATSRRVPWRWMGYPGYRSGPWYKSLSARDPRKIELLINALGFPHVEELAHGNPNWRNDDRREKPRPTVKKWKAVVDCGGRQVTADVVDISPLGAQIRLPGGHGCDALAIGPGTRAMLTIWNTAIPLRVVWSRTQSFGARFETPPVPQ